VSAIHHEITTYLLQWKVVVTCSKVPVEDRQCKCCAGHVACTAWEGRVTQHCEVWSRGSYSNETKVGLLAARMLCGFRCVCSAVLCGTQCYAGCWEHSWVQTSGCEAVTVCNDQSAKTNCHTGCCCSMAMFTWMAVPACRLQCWQGWGECQLHCRQCWMCQPRATWSSGVWSKRQRRRLG
jgi:hypothetical protein